MAKRLGKKARKFARKNLQSVQKRQRKLNSFFKRKASSSRKGANVDGAEEHETKELAQQTIGGVSEDNLYGAVSGNNLESLFVDDGDDLDDDVSDSDGYLSEDPECPYISESENEKVSEGKNKHVTLLGQNKEIHLEIAKQKRKLDRLLEKDPQFSEFLEKRRSHLDLYRNEEIYSDEESDTSYPDGAEEKEMQTSQDRQVITRSTVDVWCWMVMEEPNGSALRNLLNGFHTACQYGISSGEISSQRIPNREVYSKIVTFVLDEVDGIFRRLLGISGSCSKDSSLKFKNRSEWTALRPLMKSYLRSTLFHLNQITDGQLLVFVLSRLRVSAIFFAAFPSLARRLIKILVHLWVSGDESVSSSSFFIMRDVASQISSDCLDTCLMKTYSSFIARCKFVEPTNLKHMEFLMNCVVELYSLDVQKSCQKILLSVQQLTNILRQALKTKKKEELDKIHNWQYIYCISLWAKFITCNLRDHDLQPLLFLVIHVVRGIVHLFPGPCHIPLRFKCVQILNQLSLASGVFIPVASLLFDCLDYWESSKSDRTQRQHINFSAMLKVPKQLVKLHDFEEECILSAIELLTAHFAQWSSHISFPELVTIPLILLRRFHDRTTFERLRRPLKRLIEEVERNSDYIQRKRDEVSFSPNDQASIESFLKLEKSGATAPFTHYYTSVLQNSRCQKMGC